MKIVRFLGGFGNQMFQYAFYKMLEKRFDHVSADLEAFKDYKLHNGYELERVFGICVKIAPRFFVKLYDHDHQNFFYKNLRKILHLRNSYHNENPLFVYDESIFSDSGNKLYWGYWQNPAYFKEISQDLINDFTFKLPLNIKNSDVMNNIQKCNSIALHVRRGDYLKEPLLGGICNHDYFKNAIQLINNTISNPSFFVFSDDIPWCKENLEIPGAVFVDWNRGKDSYVDMQLMSNCKHAIISNSSFSWWAGYLNKNKNKLIIAPNKWVNDAATDATEIIPKEWIKI